MLIGACPLHTKQHDHWWILLTAAQTQNNTQESLSFFFVEPGGVTVQSQAARKV